MIRCLIFLFFHETRADAIIPPPFRSLRVVQSPWQYHHLSLVQAFCDDATIAGAISRSLDIMLQVENIHMWRALPPAVAGSIALMK